MVTNIINAADCTLAAYSYRRNRLCAYHFCNIFYSQYAKFARKILDDIIDIVATSGHANPSQQLWPPASTCIRMIEGQIDMLTDATIIHRYRAISELLMIWRMNSCDNISAVAWHTLQGFHLKHRKAGGDTMGDILYDLYGKCSIPNPTTPMTVLARLMYEANDFADIGILADAVEESMGDAMGIVSHLRNGKPHYRGCYVIDAILGKP